MRQILFRGKRTDNGEWVYGAYFNMYHKDGREHIHHFIIPDNTDISLGTPIEKIQVEVIPETVGQFTGLTDCNGKEIYEGDIVKFDCGLEATISYSQIAAAFMFDYRGGQSMPIGVMYVISDHVLFDAEVIGNIHDNPELIPNQPTAI